MKWVLQLMTGLSLALCLAAAVLWARSYRVSDVLTRTRESHANGPWHATRWDLWAGRGRLVVCRVTWSVYRAADAPSLNGWSIRVANPTDPAFAVPGLSASKGFLGLHVLPGFWGPGSRCIVVPLWMIVLAGAVMSSPLLVPIRRLWLRRRRRKMGLCLHCGYDLRASPERCPECGTPISANQCGQADH